MNATVPVTDLSQVDCIKLRLSKSATAQEMLILITKVDSKRNVRWHKAR